MIEQIFQVVLIPLLIILTEYAVKYIKVKMNKLTTEQDNETAKKYLNMLDDTITSCVIATTQTYVDTLKKRGEFNEAAQKEAFQMTYEAVVDILSEDVVEYLAEVVGDLKLYVTQKIEAEVNITKSV